MTWLLDFASLYLELSKMQANAKLSVEFFWSTNHYEDTLYLGRIGQSVYQHSKETIRIIRHSWDNYLEFCLGNQYYYRLDRMTLIPIQIDKNSSSFFGWGHPPIPPVGLQSLAEHFYQLVIEMNAKMVASENARCAFHSRINN